MPDEPILGSYPTGSFIGTFSFKVTVEGVNDPFDGFTKICDGDYDHVAEQAFFMCGGLEDVDKKWEEIQKSL